MVCEKIFRPTFLLSAIIVFAFVVRIMGIQYGLPLWLIDDEPPFALAALKMIQLKTILPVFHLEEFKNILYYPPYLSYIYLLPFSILLAVKYFFFQGGFDQFLYYITNDLSQFFIIARFINILLGVATIGLLYRITKNIFQNVYLSLLASFLLSTSLLHILFSFIGRHWLPTSFLFTLTLFFLKHSQLIFQEKIHLCITYCRDWNGNKHDCSSFA